MAINTKTKAVAALGLLDITRQLVTAWTAKRQAEQERIGFGRGVREDARHAWGDARDRASDVNWTPWRHQPTAGDRIRTWGPIVAVVIASTAAVLGAARYVARHESDIEPDETATDSRVIGAAHAGSNAIDAGVTKVVAGGTGVAVGTASGIAAGSTAIHHAVVDRAKAEVDERVVQPAKRKAITVGAFGFVALTLYVIVVSVAVQLLVALLG